MTKGYILGSVTSSEYPCKSKAGRWKEYMHMVQKGARILGIGLKHHKVPGSHAKYLQVLRIFANLGEGGGLMQPYVPWPCHSDTVHRLRPRPGGASACLVSGAAVRARLRLGRYFAIALKVPCRECRDEGLKHRSQRDARRWWSLRRIGNP